LQIEPGSDYQSMSYHGGEARKNPLREKTGDSFSPQKIITKTESVRSSAVWDDK